MALALAKSEGRGTFASKCGEALEELSKGDISDNDKTAATKAIDAAKAWIKSNPTADTSAMEKKMTEMQAVVDPIVLKGKLDAYCKEIKGMLANKNFEENEKATVEKALAEYASGSSQKKEELEAKLKALGAAVNPIIFQVNKRSGSVSGKMVYKQGGKCYFEVDEQPSKARLMLEEATGVVFIDLDECADDNSLACIVEDLQQRTQRGMVYKTIVMNIEASPKHPAFHRYLMRTGAFMVGLRSVGLPIMAVISGRVAGPAWSLLLTADYRYAVKDTVFHMPICSAPGCLQTLVGAAVATELCLSTGTCSAADMAELGILNQVRPTLDEAKYAAYEFAKRIGGFPHLGCRQTLRLMCPAAQSYADAIAEDPSLILQVYPDDVVTNA
jgi:enoyl-CoA hydratase/carnithine racemase